MIRPVITMFLALFITNAIGQDLVFGNYNWDAEPLYDLSGLDTSDGEVILKERMMHEYYFKEEEFLEHMTMHRAVYVNSDKAIERNNKQYIPARSMTEKLTEKARVIKPNGEISVLDEDDVETYENEEEGLYYRYFALEGIEKGSIIELLIQQTRIPNHTGTRVFLQRDVPVRDIRYELISPYHLLFAFKSYNGLMDAVSDTLYENKNNYLVEASNLPAFDPDSQGAFDANRKFFIHKLSRNTINNKNDFTSYSQFAQSIYSRIYKDHSKKISKGLNGVLKDAKVSMSRDTEDKVRTLEVHVKENFRVVDANADALRDLEFILENAVCSEWGATSLMANLLRQLDIKHELVVTSDRLDLKFDPDFEAYSFLDHMLIYIPSIDAYVAPGDLFLRTGITPSQCAGNHGLFISEVKVGDFRSAVGEIKKIPETVYSDNQHNLDIDVAFDSELTKANIHVKTELSGYYAQYLQPIYQYLNEEQQREALEEHIKYIDSEGELTNLVATNDRSYHFGSKPMVIEADINSESFIEQVGESVLFKLGLLIGQQMEMYGESAEDRQYDVETEYARKYERVITIQIPEGYTLSGLESLLIDKVHKEGDLELGFVSTYTITDTELEVRVEEYYKNQIYPKELFEIYRDVINAASDFNKATVLLKKT